MKRLAIYMAAVCAAFGVVIPVRAEPRVHHIFIISFDGGKPAVIQKSAMPTFFSMAQAGSHTWDAQTVFPSLTLVSHTSMLSGVGPEKHHIGWNDWTPDKGMTIVPTVFSVAKAKGFTTAMFVGKPKFIHLFLPGSLDNFSLPAYGAKNVSTEAISYIQEKKPNLCFIHFADGDGAGHSKGWGSPEQITAFGVEDEALATVKAAIERAGLADDSVIILTADHGGHDKTHGTRSPEDMTIPWVAWGKGVRPGFTITAPVTTYDTAATALWLLDVPIPVDWDGKPVISAFE